MTCPRPAPHPVRLTRALPCQVPFLSREAEAVHGQAVVLEALQALYNICFFHKRVHLEVAASSGIVPHLCRSAGAPDTVQNDLLPWLTGQPQAVYADQFSDLKCPMHVF